MKNLKIFALLALCVAVLSSCISHENEEVPEYGPMGFPKFGNVVITPNRVVTEEDAVTVEASVSCIYGLKAVAVGYWINDDTKTMRVVGNKFYRGDKDTSVKFKADKIIPQQLAGTKVSFQVVAKSTFDVQNTSEVYSFTVVGREKAVPTFGDMKRMPDGTVTDKDAVSIEVPVNCTSGLKSVVVTYWINGDRETLQTVGEVIYNPETDKNVIYRVTDAIKALPAGTTVSYRLLATSAYGVEALSKIVEYEVVKSAE